MRKCLIALMVGLLAFSSPALAQQNNPPPPPPSPFICDPQENPGSESACWALLAAVGAIWGIAIYEGTKKEDRPIPKPASP